MYFLSSIILTLFYEDTIHNEDYIFLFCPSLLSRTKLNIFSLFHLILYYYILLLLMPCTEYSPLLLSHACWEWYSEASLLLSSLLVCFLQIESCPQLPFPVLRRDFWTIELWLTNTQVTVLPSNIRELFTLSNTKLKRKRALKSPKGHRHICLALHSTRSPIMDMQASCFLKSTSKIYFGPIWSL